MTTLAVTDLASISFRDMPLGETFITKGILSGVDDTPLVWELVELNLSRTSLTFSVTYHDINIGNFIVHPSEGYRVTAL